MKQIHNICAEQNIQYFLHYGTLLGAVRLKGFIPWDDDFDVAMFREDYQRFIEYMKQHAEEVRPLELLHYSVNKQYIYPIVRVSDTRYTVRYPDAKEYGLGLFVDIYPIDGWGNSEEEATKIHNRFDTITKLVRLAGIDRFVTSPLGRMRSILKKISFSLFKHIGPRFFLRIIDHMGRKRDCNRNQYVGCVIWSASVKAACEKKYLKPISLEFEGNWFWGPSGYDKILRRLYGDYWELPPENERTGHHEYTAYLK